MRDSNGISRRNFLAYGGGLVASTLAVACGRGSQQEQPAESALQQAAPAGSSAQAMDPDAPYAGFRVGIQSYCFREFKQAEDLYGMIHSLELAHIELWPDGHLPVETPQAELEARVKAFHDQGISIDACGVVDFENDEAKARQIFEYAKTLGVLAISAGPSHDALPLLARLTQEYGLPIAIHNHGPADTRFGTSALIRQHLVPLPTSVGLCVDTGHFQRVGEDPLAAIEEFGDRVHGIHLKDMVPNAEGNYEDVIVGRGSLDLADLVKLLKKIGFKGYFSLEYESDPQDPLPAMRECLAELRKACAQAV